MTEFSTRASLDVTVSERSLSDARNQIESRLGSVRAGVTATDGGRSSNGLGGGLGDRLGETNDLLVQIRDTLEDQAFASAGRGGESGGGLSALSLLARVATAGTAAVGTGAAAGLGTAIGTTPLLGTASRTSDRVGDGFLTRTRRTDEGIQFGSGASAETIPAPEWALDLLGGEFGGLSSTITSAFSPGELQSPLTSALSGAFRDSAETFRAVADPGQIGQTIGSTIASTVTQGVQFREPRWLSDLRSLFGGGGGGGSGSVVPRGGVGRASDVPATRIPGQTGAQPRGGGGSLGDLNVSLEAGGLQRDLERSVQNALGDLQNNRAFRRAVEAIIRDAVT